jgi:hypothetical protein
MQHRNAAARKSGWTKIPEGRRHFYVYALLFLGAVVGNSLKNAITGPVPSDEPTAALRAEAARIEGMKDSVKSLYH